MINFTSPFKIPGLSLLLVIFCLACKDATPKEPVVIKVEAKFEETEKVGALAVMDYDTSQWAEITAEDGNFHFDIRYATSENFTKKVIYDCARCFLRPHVKEQLLNFEKVMRKEFGLGVVLFDCYRPRPYQQRLWDIVPDERYVGNPAKGSMHNRGMAVDIALTDEVGIIMDFGTDFDHFGPASFHSATSSKISKEAVENRLFLKGEIAKFGFQPITSEWWHYSYRENVLGLEGWVWSCD